MSDRTHRLLQVMQEHGLYPRDVARLVGVSPATVYNWRSPGSPDIIPRHRLDLLELRLGLVAPTPLAPGETRP